ncbi:hypothetical protein ACF0H5_014205 [Mactra antiquata]
MGDGPEPGLTNSEKDLVRESWAPIKAEWKVHGIEYFIRLFKEYPYTQKYFKTFDNMEIDEIRASTKLRAHVINFKSGLNSLIKNLDEPEVLEILIQKLAENHFRRNIKAATFQKAFDLFITYGKEVAQFDEKTCEAWAKTLKVVTSIIDGHQQTLSEPVGE